MAHACTPNTTRHDTTLLAGGKHPRAQGDSDFQSFLTSLGWWVDIGRHGGHNGGLEAATFKGQLLYSSMFDTELAFLVPSLHLAPSVALAQAEVRATHTSSCDRGGVGDTPLCVCFIHAGPAASAGADGGGVVGSSGGLPGANHLEHDAQAIRAAIVHVACLRSPHCIPANHHRPPARYLSSAAGCCAAGAATSRCRLAQSVCTACMCSVGISSTASGRQCLGR